MILKIMGDELLEITGITSNNPILIIDNATSQLTKKFPLRNFVLRYLEYFQREKMEYINIKVNVSF
tara:strand:+ start:269 stop:466 length:198 start_codon:yes stop_codon:yes gene_type:complete